MFLDGFILLLILLSVILSVVRGFVIEVFTVVGLGAGAYLGTVHNDFIASFLEGTVTIDILRYIISFLLTFAISFVFVLLLGSLVFNYFEGTFPTVFSKAISGLVGAAKASILIMVLLSPAVISKSIKKGVTEGSIVTPVFVYGSEKIWETFAPGTLSKMRDMSSTVEKYIGFFKDGFSIPNIDKLLNEAQSRFKKGIDKINRVVDENKAKVEEKIDTLKDDINEQKDRLEEKVNDVREGYKNFSDKFK